MSKRARGVKIGVHNIAFWSNFAFQVDLSIFGPRPATKFQSDGSYRSPPPLCELFAQGFIHGRDILSVGSIVLRFLFMAVIFVRGLNCLYKFRCFFLFMAAIFICGINCLTKSVVFIHGCNCLLKFRDFYSWLWCLFHGLNFVNFIRGCSKLWFLFMAADFYSGARSFAQVCGVSIHGCNCLLESAVFIRGCNCLLKFLDFLFLAAILTRGLKPTTWLRLWARLFAQVCGFYPWLQLFEIFYPWPWFLSMVSIVCLTLWILFVGVLQRCGFYPCLQLFA